MSAYVCLHPLYVRVFPVSAAHASGQRQRRSSPGTPQSSPTYLPAASQLAPPTSPPLIPACAFAPPAGLPGAGGFCAVAAGRGHLRGGAGPSPQGPCGRPRRRHRGGRLGRRSAGSLTTFFAVLWYYGLIAANGVVLCCAGRSAAAAAAGGGRCQQTRHRAGIYSAALHCVALPQWRLTQFSHRYIASPRFSFRSTATWTSSTNRFVKPTTLTP